MTDLLIQRLDIKGFRGVSQRKSLLFNGKSVLLFGENGTGKSTFVDALEKLFTGEVYTLDHRAQGLSSEKHGPHVKSAAENPEIAVTFSDGTKVAASSITRTLPEGVQHYLQAGRQPVYILRRAQLLEFIESQPRDRYELLRPYLALSEVEEVEAALANADEQLQAEFNNARRELSRQRDDLVRHLGLNADEEVSEARVIEALNARLGSAGRNPLAKVSEISAATQAIDSDLSKFGDISKPVAITNLIDSLEELFNAGAVIDVAPLASSLLRLREFEARQTATIYEKVLEDGARWIEAEHRKECPLCEQEMQRFTPEEVVRRARARLEEAHELLALRQQVQSEVNALKRVIGESANGADRIRRAQLAKVSQQMRQSAEGVLIPASEALSNLARIVDQPVADIELGQLHSVGSLFERTGKIHGDVSQVLQMLRAELAALPSSAAAQNLLQLREFLLRLKSNWEKFGQAWMSFKTVENRANVSARAVSTFRNVRKEVVGEIFSQVSGDVDRLYYELHKHHESSEQAQASHRNIRLELREAVQRSINIRADFYTCSDTDPRAYYSDAHLDTLGLSIFLALRRWYGKQYPTFKLLVLDDVISSVDAGHAVRLAELLLTEFSDFQILLTTHDRIWFEHLRDIQNRCGVAQSFVNKTIYSWTIDDGPDLREPEDEERRLRESVQNGTPYEVAALAGRLLEHILQEMRYSLRLPVPAKPGELYEIGDLWPSFYKEVRRNYPTLYAKAQNTLDALDVSWPLRNWIGAHFNRWALNVPLTVAREFGQAVLNLFEFLFCSDCRRFIAPSSTPLGQIACRCGSRIYPAPGKTASPTTGREEVVSETAGALKDAKLSSKLHLEWKRAERNREN